MYAKVVDGWTESGLGLGFEGSDRLLVAQRSAKHCFGTQYH